MPRQATNAADKYRINRERYRVLRGLGAHWTAASSARCPARFIELCERHGGNAADYPTLTVVRIGGHPRNPTPKNQAIRRRYHVLRDAGATAHEACVGSKGDASTAVMLRKLLRRKAGT